MTEQEAISYSLHFLGGIMSRFFKTVTMLSLFVAMTVGTACAETVKIGVLAKDGPAKALAMWQATGDYLSSKIPGKTFEIIPLEFKKIYPAVEAKEVDFFLTGPSMYVTTKEKYGASALVTMINSREGKATETMGGVILTTSSNDAVNSLADLKGKKFMAVEPTSMGGWQMAWKALADAGIDPKKDFAALEFGGKHDNVVLAVLNEKVDAGTVRTDTLERMAAAGAIVMDDFKIINKQTHGDFPFVCSTALYPEWPLAKTASTPDALAAQVATALKELKVDEPAAKNAKIVGWKSALDYGVVAEMMKKLGVEASAN